MRIVFARSILSAMQASRNPFPEGGGRTSEARAGAVLAIAMAALGVSALSAHAQSPMVQGWLAANVQCKSGPGDEPKTRQACARRDQLGEKLKRRGCVYQEDGDWWKCPR